jgi:uncharacterized Zn ribbon protein
MGEETNETAAEIQPARSNTLIDRLLKSIAGLFDRPDFSSVKSIIGDKYTEIRTTGDRVLFWISGNCECSATLESCAIQVSQKTPKKKKVTFVLNSDGKIIGDNSVIIVDYLIVKGSIVSKNGTIHAKQVFIDSNAIVDVQSITYEKLHVSSGAQVTAALIHNEGN